MPQPRIQINASAIVKADTKTQWLESILTQVIMKNSDVTLGIFPSSYVLLTPVHVGAANDHVGVLKELLNCGFRVAEVSERVLLVSASLIDREKLPEGRDTRSRMTHCLWKIVTRFAVMSTPRQLHSNHI